MKRQTVAFVSLLGAGLLVSQALAADYTWLGKTANWLDALNWRTGGSDVTWANGNAAIFEAGGPNLNIAIGDAVSTSQMTIRDNYTYSGIGPVTLNGFCYVAENKIATYEVPLKAATQFKKGAVGTAVIKGGAEFAKMQVGVGTLRLAEGTTVKVTAASTAASTDSSLALTGGNLVLEKGSKLELTDKSSFAPNSGSGVTIAGGTLSVTNAGEFLIGFNDINKSGGTMTSKRSFVTVADGGKLLAKTIRLSKATKTEITSNPEYGRLNLNTNGFVSANNIYLESTSYHGVINFNGGVLEHNPTAKQVEAKTYAMISHANMSLKVKEGGAHIKLVNSGLNRTFGKSFESAAEKDGGFTIEGDGGVAYMNVTNTFNGPTTLTGAGGLIYVPKFDRALGLEPLVPTNNIIAASGTASGPILHSDTAFDLHKNRNVLIKKNTTFRVGNGGNLRLLGQINSDPAAPTSTVLQVVGNWAGALTIATTDGRENKIGRVRSDGHLIFENGTTTITKVTTDVAGNAPIYAARASTATAYSKNYGVIEVTGGTLKAVTGARYTETQNYGQIKVSGGKLDVSGNNQELLNGMDTPGRVEVSGTGEIAAYIVRATQVLSTSDKAYGSDGLPAVQIHVATGGVLRLHHFSIDYGKSGLVGRIDLDGGTIICRSSQDKLIGSANAANQAKWDKILARICPGGAIVDTAGFNSGIPAPLISACANDGGVCKLGAGTLTLSGANTYNGPTRCDKGTLKFANEGAFPGGDLAVSAKALKANGSIGTITSPRLVFKPGAKVRIVEADGVDPQAYKRVTIATSDVPMENPPTQVVVVDKDGNERSGADWRVMLSDDGETLSFGRAQGCAIILR